jgi:hypothetical protein
VRNSPECLVVAGTPARVGIRSCRGHVLLLLPRRKCRYLASALCTTVKFEVSPWPVGVISVVLFFHYCYSLPGKPMIHGTLHTKMNQPSGVATG